jgi:hypothetical protein
MQVSLVDDQQSVGDLASDRADEPLGAELAVSAGVCSADTATPLRADSWPTLSSGSGASTGRSLGVDLNNC